MKKKKVFIIVSILLMLIIIVLGFWFVNKDKVDDPTDAKTNFVINDTLKDGNNKKVKVIILAGQSNASGVGHNEYLKNNIGIENYKKYDEGFDNVYINYFVDNGRNKSDGFVNVKIGQGCDVSYFGPELGMGEKLSELYPDEEIFIIKYSWSGSNLHTQWNVKGGKLYGAFIKFVNESMHYLEDKDYDAEIVAMNWMQGESDSLLKYVGEYEDNLINLINYTRRDLRKYISNKGMLFIDAYISDCNYWPEYKKINEAKYEVSKKSNLNLYIDTISEGLVYKNEPFDNPDLAHYDSLSNLKLGYLFIEKYVESIA